MLLLPRTGWPRGIDRAPWPRPRRRAGRNRRAAFRPRVDLLEGRALLSTLTVTNTQDSGEGSLRYEVAQASAGDTIEFAFGRRGATIELTSGPIVIDRSLSIRNRTGGSVIVSGGGASRVFVVDLAPDASTELNGLTITGGVAPLGGAILNEAGGTLILRRDRLTGNQAVGVAPAGAGQGGAVATVGPGTTLSVDDCVFGDNEALGADGAAASSTGDDVNGGDGDGGAVFNDAGTRLDIDSSLFSGNQAVGGAAGFNFDDLAAGGDGNGGAVYFVADGATDDRMVDTTLSGNQAIGGPGGRNEEGVGSYGIGGAVAGVSPDGAGASSITLEDCTLVSNVALGGPGGFDVLHQGGIALGGGLAFFPSGILFANGSPTLTVALEDDAITLNQAAGAPGLPVWVDNRRATVARPKGAGSGAAMSP
jgi:hypothetical protein